jgi:hypothetical protein
MPFGVFPLILHSQGWNRAGNGRNLPPLSQ